MNRQLQLVIFGEVLFDCFPGGERLLGGAPFNVAWHSQALGNRPQFVSRIGEDELGGRIISTMTGWGMSTENVQHDTVHPTGRVEVDIIDNEPHYDITPDCAYDFIKADEVDIKPAEGILYHGTLALRNRISRNAFAELAKTPGLKIFLDVNLRSPWWKKEEVYSWLENAHWVKLNQNELELLGYASADIDDAMADFQKRFGLHHLILTRGKEGAIVCTDSGDFHDVVPGKVERFVDTVGAGDAFTAIYIHGLMANRPIPEILNAAQRFSGKVIGLRGAISAVPDFYRDFIDIFK